MSVRAISVFAGLVAAGLASMAVPTAAAGEARKLAQVGHGDKRARGPAAWKDRAVRQARVESLADLDGTWSGVYAGGLNPRPVQFVLVLRVRGNRCHGRTEEPNTFGHPSAPRLYANVECRLVGWPARLVLTKTYDGTGGQFHSVHYDGEISLDGRSVIGRWRTGTVSDRFSLARQ